MILPINPAASALGKQNAILTGTGTRYFVPDFEGCLSLKTVVKGFAIWEAGKRSFRVSEGNYLILNDRQRYSVTIEAQQPVTTFCLFFERGYVEDIHYSLLRTTAELLDEPHACYAGQVTYFEALQPVDGALRIALRQFSLNLKTMSWAEWEASFLRLGEMLVRSHTAATRAIGALPAVRPGTRVELYRRLLLGRDLMLSSWESRVNLKQAAREACLSPYHFHRSFLRAFGETPHRYLVRHRLMRTAQLLRGKDRSVTEVCLECGFESPSSFSALFRSRFGVPPSEFRKIR